ncbi:MAG: Ig-like domain-containing protein [Chitinophagaceae bacterium]|nr:Ig-like domain-containing protein [Chitinophagaceae bacterium]
MKKLFLFFLILLALSKILVLSSGCANIIPPSGGAQDTIPPVLLKVSPDDSTRNFTGKTIVFTFDEFIDAQNVYENLLVSPLLKTTPAVDGKLKTVTVKIKDSLEANTTYTFDFGIGIKDFTEGNPVRNFRYTFSTGSYIDSLELQGKVILAETGKIDTTLIVMLHTNPADSAVTKEKPRYIAKLDSRGDFHFKNLPPKTFYIYALKNASGTYSYNDRDLFAFADKPVTVQSTTESVTLYAYTPRPTTSGPASALSLNLNPGRGGKPGATVDKRLKYQTSLVNEQQDLLTSFNMTFEQPLRLFDSSKIKLYTDSAYSPVSSYQFIKDSNNKKLSLKIEWKENTLYHIIMDKDFADDSSGKKLLKTDTLSFKTKKLSEYGSLKIKFKDLKLDKNPVLLIMQGENIYQSFPLSGPDFFQRLFLPGEFELRILSDTNKNGKWDPGEFFGKHKQPEIVKPVERKITVKAAWQNEFDIAL